MINYKIKDTKFFLKYMKELGKTIYEAYIHFGGKIKIIGLDPSRICIFEFIFGGESLEIIEDEETKIGICFTDLEKIFRRFPNSAEISIKKQDNELIITGNIGNRIKTFKLHEIDMGEDEKVPIENLIKIPYNVIMKLDGSDFLDIVRDVEINSEILTIITRGDTVIFEGVGNCGISSTEITLASGIYSDESSSYSIRFLKNILSSMKDSQIIVMFKTDYPISLYDKLSDSSYMRYFLAPRCETDD